jgi:hypothetical protein
VSEYEKGKKSRHKSEITDLKLELCDDFVISANRLSISEREIDTSARKQFRVELIVDLIKSTGLR